MRIGIMGSDDRAKAIGRLLRNGGHQLIFSDPLATDRAEQLAGELGAGYLIPYRQAMWCEVLFLAIPRREVDRAITAIGSGAEPVFVDAVADERGNGSHSGTEILARKLDSRHVVRALINMPQAGANIAICGDDPNAKSVVDRVLQDCGCLTTDRGPLSHATELEAPLAAA